VVHGGVHYSMADTGMALALMGALDDRQRCTTIEIKVTYYKAVIEGELTCSTRVVFRGRRIAFLQSQIRNGEALVAEATGTYYISEISK
jgi:acyl-CoA thioesterase